MFNFKSFAAITITAASIFTSNTAQAAQLSSGQRALVNALHTAGVELEVGKCESNEAFGFYNPKVNFIGICANVATTPQQRWETLRHEAVHAAQKCINPSMTSMVKSVAYIEYHANQSDADFIMKAYGREDWAIELEAFTLMRRSNAYVAQVVNKACN